MSELYDLVQQPSLDEPLLIVTLEGWVDAGLGAAAALAALLGSVPTEVVASFDVDTLLDHRARRPVVRGAGRCKSTDRTDSSGIRSTSAGC